MVAGTATGTGEIPAPPALRRGRPAPRSLAVSAAAVAAAMLLPAVYLAVRASEAGGSTLSDVLLDGRTLGLLLRTLALAIAVTGASLAIGVPLAWLTARTDLPGRRAWAVLTALPLVIPSYIGAFTIVGALGPKGIVQGWLAPLGVDRLPSIYGFPGAWLALTLFTYPYVLLPVRAAIRRLDPALEEVSLTLGRSRAQTLRRVVLPQLRPAIAAGSLLCALYAVHDFGAVSILRYDTFTRAIFIRLKTFDRASAAVLSLLLVVLALVVVGAEASARGRTAYHRIHASAARRPALTPLGRWRWAAVAGCAVLVALSLGLPLGVIGYWTARSVRAGSPLAETAVAGLHSLQAGALAALTAGLAAWPVAHLGARYPGRLSRAAETASYVGYALPGIVVAFSLGFFALRLAPVLYQTLPLLMFAYVVLFLPQASGALRASLMQVNPSLEEAARTLGSRPLVVARRVLLPLVRPGVLAGTALVFLTTMKELPATLLLAPVGFDTLATQVWGATSASFFDRAAAPALALVLLSSLPLAVSMEREAREV